MGRSLPGFFRVLETSPTQLRAEPYPNDFCPPSCAYSSFLTKDWERGVLVRSGTDPSVPLYSMTPLEAALSFLDGTARYGPVTFHLCRPRTPLAS